MTGNPNNPDRQSAHDALWAPWRMDYILQPRTGACFLCKISEAKEDDEANFVLTRRQHCFVVLNRFPYNNGHLLISPYAHKAELTALEDEELVELARVTRDMQKLLQDAMYPHGFNVGINLGQCAGAGVPGHLHIHIVPRWNGDTNFMPVTAHTKIIVQSLESLYQVLRERLNV